MAHWLRVAALICPTILALAMAESPTGSNHHKATWNNKLAASYLDDRTLAWKSGGGMDHGTFCISCHTALPFALARSSLQSDLKEVESSSAENQVIASILKRVDTWDGVNPYLGDHKSGFGTESVLNALVLAQHDAKIGQLSETTRLALKIMWAQQVKTGDRAGSWPWVNFGNEPWEASDSDFWGATLALLASAAAPEGYINSPQIQGDLKLLENYLDKGESERSLFNRLSLLLAASKVPGLISNKRQATIVSDALSLQEQDGGWSTSSLLPSNWSRHDGSPKQLKSDGYGTGFVTYVLERARVSRTSPQIKRGLTWLSTHQDPSTGAWPTSSPNTTRDPSTDIGKFMTDAATAYAVLALVGQDKR